MNKPPSLVEGFQPGRWQPRPRYNGAQGMPLFSGHAQAAYALEVFNRLLGLGPLFFADALTEEERSAVERTVKAFLESRKLVPQ